MPKINKIILGPYFKLTFFAILVKIASSSLHSLNCSCHLSFAGQFIPLIISSQY
jgi:hypothetical protein